MEIYQLEELVALAEHKTISKASEAIGVSQPAMSRSMKLLEEELGVPIFSRTSNTITLNETGMKAVEYARSITDSIRKAVEGIRAFDRSLRTVLVGSVAPAPLWNVLPFLSSLYRDKTVAGEMKDENTLIRGLKNGVYSYIITTEPVSLSSSFSTLLLGSEHLFFLLDENDPRSSSESLSFADLDGENMLLFDHIGLWRKIPERMMPHSKFFIQEDRSAFVELVRRSSIPSFSSTLARESVKGKVEIPISDREASIDFYISSRSAERVNLSLIVKSFHSA